MKNFPDECVSNGNLKPWKNYNIKVDILIYFSLSVSTYNIH